MGLKLEQREGNSRNLILGGQVVHSWASPEAPQAACCCFWATSELCCIFGGLKAKTLLVWPFCCWFGAELDQDVADEGLPGVPSQSCSCCPGWTICTQCSMDGDSWGHFWALEPTVSTHSLLPALIYKSTFSSDRGLSRRAPKCLSLLKPLSEHHSILGGRILSQLSFF